jgi:hypothetical protein
MILVVYPRSLPEAKGAADVDSLTQVKAKRFQFLRRLHEATGGNTLQMLDTAELGRELGWAQLDVDNVSEYLEAEGLLEFATFGTISITHAGVLEVEAALEKPEQPTLHFPPVNFIYIAQMDRSQIQQGTTASSQTVTFGAADLEPIRQFIADLKSRLTELEIAADEQEEANLQIATMEAQLASKRPSPVIIKESLHSARKILEGGAGNLVAAAFLSQLPQLIALIPK